MPTTTRHSNRIERTSAAYSGIACKRRREAKAIERCKPNSTTTSVSLIDRMIPYLVSINAPKKLCSWIIRERKPGQRSTATTAPHARKTGANTGSSSRLVAKPSPAAAPARRPRRRRPTPCRTSSARVSHCRGRRGSVPLVASEMPMPAIAKADSARARLTTPFVGANDAGGHRRHCNQPGEGPRLVASAASMAPRSTMSPRVRSSHRALKPQRCRGAKKTRYQGSDDYVRTRAHRRDPGSKNAPPTPANRRDKRHPASARSGR